MRPGLRTIAMALALLWIAGPPISAQTTGRIEGTVSAQGGGLLPGVKITVTSPSLQGERVVTSSPQGAFRFPSLPPGTYTVRAAVDGFNTLAMAHGCLGDEAAARESFRRSLALQPDQPRVREFLHRLEAEP